jgi:Spy/CpxP family protein refolding chaperone
MKNKISISTLLIVLIFSATSVFAWPGHGNKGENCDRRGAGMNNEQRMENHLEKMAVILDLNKDQQEKIKALAENHQKERQELRTKMHESRKALREFRFSTDVNVDEYRAKAHQQADLKADMMAQKVQHKKSVFAVMTPEQQKKAEQLWEMRGDKRNGHDNKRGQRCSKQENGQRNCGQKQRCS